MKKYLVLIFIALNLGHSAHGALPPGDQAEADAYRCSLKITKKGILNGPDVDKVRIQNVAVRLKPGQKIALFDGVFQELTYKPSKFIIESAQVDGKGELNVGFYHLNTRTNTLSTIASASGDPRAFAKLKTYNRDYNLDVQMDCRHADYE